MSLRGIDYRQTLAQAAAVDLKILIDIAEKESLPLEPLVQVFCARQISISLPKSCGSSSYDY